MNSNTNEIFYLQSSPTNPEILLQPIEPVENNSLDLLMEPIVDDHVDELYRHFGLPNLSGNTLETAARVASIFEPPQQQIRATEPLMVAYPVRQDQEWGAIPALDLLPTHMPNPRPPKRIVYPDHPKKTNGISFVGSDGALYATHRMNKMRPMRVPFGLENMEQSDDPQARIGVYLSMSGVFDPIKNCAKHAADYKTDKMMDLYYKGGDAEVTVERLNGFDGVLTDVLTAPITPTIGEDNNRTYDLQFSCHTSCHTKKHGRGKELTLNYVIVKNGSMSLVHKVPLFITANPGRDCDKKDEKKTGKRKSDESVGSGSPVKREHLDVPHRFINETPYISATAHDLMDAQLPETMTAAQRRDFMLDQNAMISAVVKTALANVKRAHDKA